MLVLLLALGGIRVRIAFRIRTGIGSVDDGRVVSRIKQFLDLGRQCSPGDLILVESVLVHCIQYLIYGQRSELDGPLSGADVRHVRLSERRHFLTGFDLKRVLSPDKVLRGIKELERADTLVWQVCKLLSGKIQLIVPDLLGQLAELFNILLRLSELTNGDRIKVRLLRSTSTYKKGS